MPLIVSLLGGESTGKTTLGKALLGGLNGLGIKTSLVPEHLRDWCVSHGRAPQASEQAGIAFEQARLTDRAADTPGLQVLLTDTSPLVIAAYSEHYFDDTSLYPQAMDRQRRVGLTLLMGLDLPWVADGCLRDGPQVREAIDALLRRHMLAMNLPFQTIHGVGEVRTRQTLRAIGLTLGQTLLPQDPDGPQSRRPWVCDSCSDPDCEHRLFTQLLQQRPAVNTP